jgi:hypothetical protein
MEEATTRTPSAIDKLEIYQQNTIRNAVTALEFLHANRAKLEKLGLSFSHPYGKFIDFDGLKRPELLNVLRTFGGKWDKSVGYNGGLTYTRRDEYQGLTLRCYNGEPPHHVRSSRR